MTLPAEFRNQYFPVKYALKSYGALSDGKAGVRHLEEYLQSSEFLWSDWKVIWIGACALLRTSITLFQIDARSCINKRIREEISSEWDSIKKNRDDHAIFWEFLRKERNIILKQYEWPAYEMWMNEDGTIRPPARMTLLSVKPKDAKSVLIMRSGPFKDRNSLDLLQESAEWVEERIFGSIRRAGFDPDEQRNLVTFEKPPPAPPGGVILMGEVD